MSVGGLSHTEKKKPPQPLFAVERDEYSQNFELEPSQRNDVYGDGERDSDKDTSVERLEMYRYQDKEREMETEGEQKTKPERKNSRSSSLCSPPFLWSFSLSSLSLSLSVHVSLLAHFLLTAKSLKHSCSVCVDTQYTHTSNILVRAHRPAKKRLPRVYFATRTHTQVNLSLFGL